MRNSVRSMGALEWVLLVILSLFRGGLFIFGKVALSDLQSFTVVWARAGIAAVVLNILVRATSQVAGMGLIGLVLLAIDGRLALNYLLKGLRDTAVRPSTAKDLRI